MRPSELIAWVALLVAMPAAVRQLYQWWKERRADQEAEIVKKASPDLLVVGVAGGLATTLMDVLKEERAEAVRERQKYDLLEQRYFDLEQKYYAERTHRINLEEQLAALGRDYKNISDRIDGLEGK